MSGSRPMIPEETAQAVVTGNRTWPQSGPRYNDARQLTCRYGWSPHGARVSAVLTREGQGAMWSLAEAREARTRATLEFIENKVFAAALPERRGGKAGRVVPDIGAKLPGQGIVNARAPDKAPFAHGSRPRSLTPSS